MSYVCSNICPEAYWHVNLWPLRQPSNIHSQSYKAMWVKCLERTGTEQDSNCQPFSHWTTCSSSSVTVAPDSQSVSQSVLDWQRFWFPENCLLPVSATVILSSQLVRSSYTLTSCTLALCTLACSECFNFREASATRSLSLNKATQNVPASLY